VGVPGGSHQATALCRCADAARLGDDVHLTVVVWAAPTEGGLDGFVSGICDGLQPAHANILPPQQTAGLSDDRAISRITAELRPPAKGPRYEIRVSW
jgi:hypothetical protein